MRRAEVIIDDPCYRMVAQKVVEQKGVVLLTEGEGYRLRELGVAQIEGRSVVTAMGGGKPTRYYVTGITSKLV